MKGHDFVHSGMLLSAMPSGALWWSAKNLLVVSDLHLGKSERLARRGGALLPPYEVQDTLLRLQTDIEALEPGTVLCLGDTFDDLVAFEMLDAGAHNWLTRLQAGRRWVWITGNHDPAPLTLPGAHLGELREGPLTFRHIARPEASGEVSGHYHPKARLSLRGQRVARPCFLFDEARIILPAYGTYTGGLWTDGVELSGLMQPGACAVLTGAASYAVPMPRRR